MLERTIRQRISELEKERQQADVKVKAAEAMVRDKEQRLAHWRGALKDYQECHGLPIDGETATVEQYRKLGPVGQVHLWADTHEGHVIVKEITHALLDAGAYDDYRKAYNSIRSTLKRRQYFGQTGPVVICVWTHHLSTGRATTKSASTISWPLTPSSAAAATRVVLVRPPFRYVHRYISPISRPTCSRGLTRTIAAFHTLWTASFPTAEHWTTRTGWRGSRRYTPTSGPSFCARTLMPIGRRSEPK